LNDLHLWDQDHEAPYLQPMKALVLLFTTFVSVIGSAQETVPYSTSFEGAMGTLNTNFPPGWTWEDLNTVPFSNQGWQIIKNSPNAQNARTDSTAAHMFSHSSQMNNDWLFTPGIQCDAGITYTISFWYSRAMSFPSVEKLALHVGNNPTSTTMGTSVWMNTNITNGSYQQALVQWTAPMTDQFYFGFHYFSDDLEFILLLDDVSITTSPNSVEENNSFDFRLWMDGDLLNVQLPSVTGQTDLTIHDAVGRTLHSESLRSTINSLSIGDLGAGTYFARIVGSDGRVITKRFVVGR